MPQESAFELQDLTPEELASLQMDQEPLPETQQFELQDLSDDELAQIQGPPDPTLGDKLVSRFLGTDVEDPMELTRIGTMILGGVGGAVVGSKLPGPVQVKAIGTTVFSTAGALFGAVAPEAALATGEAIGFLPQGTLEKSGLSPEELRTVLEGEALLEIATGGGLAVIRGTGRAFTSVLAGIKEGEKVTAREAAQRGVALLPVQVGERTLARGYVSVMGRFPFFGSPIRKSALETQVSGQKTLSAMKERLGPISAWNEIGEIIFRDANELLTATTKMFSEQYQQVFRAAADAGVYVKPSAVTSKGDEILQEISQKTPNEFAKEFEITAGQAGEVTEQLRTWISQNVMKMRSLGPEGTEIFAKQSFEQMDGMISKIDQFLATLEPGQQRFAISRMTQLRQAAQLDMLQNVGAANAGDAIIIANRLKALDQTYSHTMSELFETSAANRFASVQRRGLRAAGATELTRIPVDKLAKTVTDLQSPQMIQELSRIVSPETMQRISSTTIFDAIERSTDKGILNPDRLIKELGLDFPTSPKAQALDEMLRLGGSDLRVADYKEMVDVLVKVGAAEIPDVSTFIARRATIGGLKSMINGLVPTAMLTAGSTAAAFSFGSLIGALAFVGGGRMISSSLSNPRNARFLKEVLDEEALAHAKKVAWVKIFRGGIAWLKDEGKLSPEQEAELNRWTNFFMIEFNNRVEEIQGQ